MTKIENHAVKRNEGIFYLAGSRIRNSEGVAERQIPICFNKPELGISTYKKRWEVETCFKAMKSSGFNIEDTHLRDIDRIARLTAMVSIAFVWAYLVRIISH